MPNPGLTARMRMCLERCIASFEEILSDLATLGQDVASGNFDELTQRHDVHVRETKVVCSEFNVLRREWESANDVAENERTEIAGYLSRAETLTRELGKVYEQSASLVDARLDSLRGSFAELRKGRHAAKGYKAGDGPEARFVDRNA